MNICFLFGAGAEGKGQIGLPQGAEFKRSIILGKDISTFSRNFSNIRIKDVEVDNGTILKHNSTSVLYQALFEKKEKSSKTWDEIIENYFPGIKEDSVKKYIEYKVNKSGDGEKIYEDFRKFYYKNVYQKLKEERIDKGLDAFLNDACICSYYDSLFNYLRKPELYAKEVINVIKIYYGALKCIYEGMIKAVKADNNANIYEKILSEKVDKNSVVECINRIENEVIEKINIEKTYYYEIRKFKNKSSNVNVWVTTTNYTHFAKKIIDVEDEHMHYLHGEFGKFENLYTKEIKSLKDFEVDEIIFPYLLVQSGIKPVINYYQIESMYKGFTDMINADKLIVIGYGFNSDDEHILNVIRERLRAEKDLVVFIHGNEKKYNSERKCIESFFNSTRIEYKKTAEFSHYLSTEIIN
ncbi:MAG: hypothetical protein IKQ88_04630 [Lachnospiraceae bacterium]|nr:hypothetical protein [Lachnospiraceae bacterium]